MRIKASTYVVSQMDARTYICVFLSLRLVHPLFSSLRTHMQAPTLPRAHREKGSAGRREKSFEREREREGEYRPLELGYVG